MKVDEKPLSGIRVLVGRARHQASALSSGLRALGADVIEIPFIEIRKPHSYKPLDTALKNIAKYDWLILTSVNGVDAIADRIRNLHLDRGALRHLQVAAIGPATRTRIEALGFKVAVVPKRYVAESVVESLRGKVEGRHALLARAKVARDVIPRELHKMGAKVDAVEAYETAIPVSSRKLLHQVINNPERRPHIVTFTSSSTVRNFVGLIGRGSPYTNLDGIRFASIGPITSATMRELGLPLHIEAKEYTITGLLKAIQAKSTRTGQRKSMK
jgi:uroporphyrinogen-III synthase